MYTPDPPTTQSIVPAGCQAIPTIGAAMRRAQWHPALARCHSRTVPSLLALASHPGKTRTGPPSWCGRSALPIQHRREAAKVEPCGRRWPWPARRHQEKSHGCGSPGGTGADLRPGRQIPWKSAGFVGPRPPCCRKEAAVSRQPCDVSARSLGFSPASTAALSLANRTPVPRIVSKSGHSEVPPEEPHPNEKPRGAA